MNVKEAFTYTCGFCEQSFQNGPHVYGHYYRSWDLLLCKVCSSGCWDGIAPHYEQKLIVHLEKEGVPLPSRNEKGWLPLPPKG